MKKKLANGLLIVGVLIIWIFVFRKASVAFQKEPDKLVFQSVSNDFRITNYAKDTFELKDFGRDPFLDLKKSTKAASRKVVSASKIIKKTKLKPSSNASDKLWPKIEYMGYIKKTDSQDKLALIRINNKLYRAREKETVEDIYIRQVFKDSIQLKWGTAVKTILK